MSVESINQVIHKCDRCGHTETFTATLVDSAFQVPQWSRSNLPFTHEDMSPPISVDLCEVCTQIIRASMLAGVRRCWSCKSEDWRLAVGRPPLLMHEADCSEVDFAERELVDTSSFTNINTESFINIKES